MNPSPVEMDGLVPERLVAPESASAMARELLQACETGAVVAPLGGGTMLDLGAPLSRIDLALSLANLHAVQDHQPANLTVRTDAGITLADLNAQLAHDGQSLPLDPPFPERATIGGILAANASGPSRIRFGSARDLLIGLRVALADGQIVHGGGDVVKNVAGYDLPRLFIGSLGTLGVIVEASFKIVPLAPHTATLLARFPSAGQAAEAGLQVLRSSLLPHALELLNPQMANALRLGKDHTLLIRFRGLASAVTQELGDTDKIVRANGANGIEMLEEEEGLWVRVRDLLYTGETLLKVGALPVQLAVLAAEAERIGESHSLKVMTDARLAGILLIGLEGERAALTPAILRIREAVAAQRGYLMLQQAPREVRAVVDIWGTPGADFEVMRKLKQELDPKNILNPGRFVGGL